MPFIRAGVHRNALSAKFFRVHGGFCHIGDVASAGVTDCCNFIDIYA